jgi:hypothetical protein
LAPTSLIAPARPVNCQVLTPFLAVPPEGGAVVGGAVVGAVVGGTGDQEGLAGVSGAGQDLQAGAVRRALAGGVQALAGAGVDQGAVAGLPGLGAGAVAVVQLDLGAVGTGRGGDVETLAERLDRGAVDGPALRGGAVAVPQLDRGAVGGTGRSHVDALAADAGDRGGLGGRRAGDAQDAHGGHYGGGHEDGKGPPARFDC